MPQGDDDCPGICRNYGEVFVFLQSNRVGGGFESVLEES